EILRRVDRGDAGLLQLGRVLRRDDAAGDHRYIEACVLDAVDHVLHQRHVAAREDGQADDVRLLLLRRVDDLLRRQANALVDHLHAGVARADGDLLGAVTMAVETGLADQESHAAAELLRHAVDVGADVVEAGDVVAHGAADAGWRAVFAKGLAQRPAPFAGGDAGLRAVDRGRHDIAAALCSALQGRERILHRARVALRAPGFQPLDLVALSAVGHGEDRLDAAGQRRRLGLGIFVDADHGLLAALDGL